MCARAAACQRAGRPLRRCGDVVFRLHSYRSAQRGGPVVERTPGRGHAPGHHWRYGLCTRAGGWHANLAYSLPPKTPGSPLRPSQQHAMMGLETAPPLAWAANRFVPAHPAMAGRLRLCWNCVTSATNLTWAVPSRPGAVSRSIPTCFTEIPGTDSARWCSTPLPSCSAACACKLFRCPTPPPKTAGACCWYTWTATASTLWQSFLAARQRLRCCSTRCLRNTVFRKPCRSSKRRWRPMG